MPNPLIIRRVLLSGGLRVDPDAAAYIAAIKAAGATVSGAQTKFISDFVTAEKTANRWAGLGCLWFPVWGIAAANAICMKTLMSGTFVGSVTHASGYIQGDGATGYLNTGVVFSSYGLSPSTAYLFSLTTQQNTTNPAVFIGCGNVNTSYTYANTTSYFPRWCNSASQSGAGATVTRTGIISFNRFSGDRILSRRITAGKSTLASVTNADAGTLSASTVFALANNGTDSVPPTIVPQFFNDARFGAVGFGLGMTDANDTAFTLNLKTLWEGVTGLVLP